MFAMVGDCGVFSREEIEDFMVEADRVRGHFDTHMMYWHSKTGLGAFRVLPFAMEILDFT